MTTAGNDLTTRISFGEGGADGFGDGDTNQSDRVERELVEKNHEVIDLNIELDKLSRGKHDLEDKVRKEARARIEIAEECELLRKKNKELREKAGKIDYMKEMEKKSEIELLKEMNDLREMVEELKVERDRIIDHLRACNLLSNDDLRLREISSENL